MTRLGDLVVQQHGDLSLWLSPRLQALGVPHGFTDRRGGQSRGLFAALNLGFSTGDEPTAVLANRAAVCAALGFAASALRFVRQVHGTTLLAPTADWPTGSAGQPPAADGLLTDQPGYLIGVRTADCLPVLLASPDGRHVAAIHAGWRGLAGGIIPRAVAALGAQAGCCPAELTAALGPAIGLSRYEVGEEVVAAFPPAAVQAGPTTSRVDCARCAVTQLRAAGVEAIDQAATCTYDHPALFYSYRRDGAVTGRQAALIAVAG